MLKFQPKIIKYVFGGEYIFALDANAPVRLDASPRHRSHQWLKFASLP